MVSISRIGLGGGVSISQRGSGREVLGGREVGRYVGRIPLVELKNNKFPFHLCKILNPPTSFDFETSQFPTNGFAFSLSSLSNLVAP